MQLSLPAPAVAAVLMAAVFLPDAALASCIGDFCVSGRDEGNTHIIDFSLASGQHDVVSPHHYNFNDGRGQRELGLNETQVSIPIPPGRPQILHYAFQVCNHAFAGSSCGPWANFSHTVK